MTFSWMEIIAFSGMFLFMTCGAALGWHVAGDEDEKDDRP